MRLLPFGIADIVTTGITVYTTIKVQAVKNPILCSQIIAVQYGTFPNLLLASVLLNYQGIPTFPGVISPSSSAPPVILYPILCVKKEKENNHKFTKKVALI